MLLALLEKKVCIVELFGFHTNCKCRLYGYMMLKKNNQTCRSFYQFLNNSNKAGWLTI